MSPERHLLFGLLALQNGFITRDQLISAFGSWTADKRRKMDRILIEHGALDEATVQVIAALEERHLALHGGDAARSLAQLNSVPPSARDQLERLNDGELKSCLSQLPAAEANLPQDVFATVAYTGPSSAGDRFIILRPHAAGGLGQVAVALDTELHREVALKEIQAKYADTPSARTRFIREAEITGGLEHPGIVPVYGLGSYSDGRPYYAMKFVKGNSLKAAIAEFHRRHPTPTAADYRGLEFRQFVQRFFDVCNAMQYAHDRGVLHRDLKPGNIMLGQYGETLVIDWGLAKPLGESETPFTPGDSGEEPMIPESSLSDPRDKTQRGSALGTLEYMSPEQAAGKHDDLGPATDVYALGATLYHLLTGNPPISPRKGESLGEVVDRIKQGEFPPPRELKPQLPRTLDAICRKALALKPNDRYASSRALAVDLENWLADEETLAAPDSVLEKVARLARRHRGVVRTAMASLLLIAVGASAFGVVIHNQRLRALELADANGRLAELERKARVSAENALLARDEALLRIARIDEGSVQLEDELQELRDDPAFVAVRLLLLRRTLLDWEFVAQRDAGRSTPQLAAARGYLQLQLAQLETDQTLRRERADAAVETLTAAAELLPQDRQLSLRLSDAHNLRGQLSSEPQRSEDFESCFRIRDTLLRGIADEGTEEAVEIRRKLLSIRHNRALLGAASQNAEAGTELQRVAGERQRLGQDHPDNLRLARDAADSEMTLARYTSQELPAVRQHYERAIADYARADAGHAGSVVRSRWFEALRGKLECDLSAGDRDAARGTADELFRLTIRVLRNSELRDLVARGFYSSGSVAFENWIADPTAGAQRDLAGDQLRLAVLLYRDLTALADAEPRHWHDLAAAAALRGQVLEDSPDMRGAAAQMYELARQALESLKEANRSLFDEDGTQRLREHVLERLQTLPPVKDRG